MKAKISDHFTYKKLIGFVLPSIAMMVFTSIYGVVDGYFVSNYAGKTDFAAINLIMPFLMVLGGFGFMFGTGGSALVGMVLGQGKKEQANRYFSMIVETTLITGVIISVIGILFLRKVALLLGATDAMIGSCVTYGRILLVFNAVFMLQNLFQSFLITAERPQFGFYVTVASGVTNMILDWLLVGVLHYGVGGAAAATVISQCVGGIIPLIYFISPNHSLLRLRPSVPDFRAIGRACTNGASELMNNISSSIVGMAYNMQLLKYAGENGVAAYGVMMYVNFIFVAMFVGYSVGTAPIISYHYGAGNTDELKNMKKRSFLIMGIAGICMTLIAQLIAPYLAKIYVGYDAELLAMTTHAFRIFTLAFLLCGVNIFTSSFFTALNNGAISAAVSFLRTLIFELAAVFILPLIFDINGIWGAVAVAEVMAFLISMIFLAKNQKKYNY